MTDPAEITQHATQAQQAGGVVAGLGALGIAATAFARLWRTIFGSKAERADASERAAEIALRAAEHSEERADRADEETASHRLALGTCEEQLRAMRQQQAEDRARISRLEREHTTCGPRIAALEREQRLSKQMLADYMRTGETPDASQMPSPDAVRAGTLAQATQHAWEE